MFIRITAVLLLLAGLLVSGLPARAGQMSGHIYVAQSALRFLSGPARAMIDANNMDAYLSGAQGPDICGVVMPKLDKASRFTSVGEETHYSDRKAELALNLLDCATTDQERAYALGWMTHYVDDIFVHGVVNNYGGFYEKDPTQHTVLEQLETKHVLVKHADMVTASLSKTIPSILGGNFGGFIFDAYHKTYPDNAINKSGDEWLVDNRPYFIKRYKEATLWCSAANERFYQSHADGTGAHGCALAGLPFPDMPSKAEYDAMQKAIEITAVEPQAQAIRITAKVNNNRLYGRFLVDYDAEIESAIQYCNQLFTLASQYVAEKDVKKKPAARIALLEVIPNVNLDQPHVNFDHATAKPGKVSIDKFTSVLTLYKNVADGKPLGNPVVLESKSAPVILPDKHFADSLGGQITFDVPVPDGSAPYQFKLLLALSGKEALAVPEYRDVDWTQVEGTYPGTWMAGAGAVMVTDIFTVRMPIPDTMIGKPGARRWVLMPEGTDIKEEEIALIKARLPHDNYRYDVVALEEAIEGGEMTARLQVTDTSPNDQKIAGRCRLVMIWFTEGKAETDVAGALGDLNKELEEAFKLLDAANKATEELMTPEQQDKLDKIAEAYSAELDKKGVGEEEKERLLDIHMQEEMKAMGIDLTKMNAVNAQAQELAAKNNVPFHVSTSLDLALADLRFDTAANWKPYEKNGNTRTNNLFGAANAVTQKNKKGLQWSIEGGITASLSTDEEQAKVIAERNKGNKEEKQTIAGFTGTIWSSEKINYANGYERVIRGEGLLKKGNVYLTISFGATATGYKQYNVDEDNKVTLVYDGADDARKANVSALADISGMYRGIRLLPTR